MSDRQPSPFQPGYGKKPAVYGGRDAEVKELTDVFDTLDFGDRHSVLVSGLRGAGKTALLSVLQDEARERGWVVIKEDASRGLMDRVMESQIPRILDPNSTELRTRLTEVRGGPASVKVEHVAAKRPAKPQLRHDLLEISESLGGRAGILITIDEVASSKTHLKELSRFALQVQHALTDGAQIMIVFAGIKVDLDQLLNQEHLTFLRRSKEYTFRRLSLPDTSKVIADTVRFGGREIAPDALSKLAQISQGYPYLIQLAGDYAWRERAWASDISNDDVVQAAPHALRAVKANVMSRVYQDLSRKDQDFLNAMAHDEGPSKMSDIKERMGESDQYVQVYKKRLIDSGYVQPAGHGYVKFSLPYLDQYVRSLVDGGHFDDQGVSESWKDMPPPTL